MDYNTITTPEIIKAILAGDSVSDTVKTLIRHKENELHSFKEKLNKEEEGTKLLVAALKLPNGYAGRTVADAIVGELRERYPEIAREADERYREKRELEEKEIDRICAR